jgi:hypothetical protein
MGAAKKPGNPIPILTLIPPCASTGGDASRATANAAVETIADLIARPAIPDSCHAHLVASSSSLPSPLDRCRRCNRSLGDGAKDQIWDIVFSLYNESSERSGPAFRG